MIKTIKGMYNNRSFSLKMGWSFLTAIVNKEKFLFPIEQRIGEPDVLYVPNEGKYGEMSLEWLIKKISDIEWNRDLRIKEADLTVPALQIDDPEIKEGTLESTEAGEQFLSLDLFDPNSEISKEDVKKIWCHLEQRFAESVEGLVTIYVNSFSENSVFSKITIPSLSANNNVTLKFIGK